MSPSPLSHTDATADADAELRRQAAEWVRRRRSLTTMVAVYLVLCASVVMIDAVDDSGNWWSHWPVIGLTAGVAIISVTKFGVGGFLDAEWEQREVDRFLARRARSAQPPRR